MRKSLSLSILLAILFSFILVGCDSTQNRPASEKNTLNYASFVKKLRDAGISTAKADAMTSDLFSGTSYGLLINGERVSIFEYPTSSDAQNEANHISPLGDTIQGGQGQATAIDWVAPPHFYRSGRLLVLYVGSKSTVISLLKSMLGLQFAGGN